MSSSILDNRDGKRLLVCFFGFCLLEIWVYLSAFTDLKSSDSHLVWEGPVSLLLLIFGFAFGLRYFAQQKNRRILCSLWTCIPILVLLAAFVPFTPLPKSDWKLEIFKAERLLKVYHQDQLKQEHKIALGGHPEGDKEVMSDSKTPLGTLLICDKGPSQFHKWLGLNYPNVQDAWRGRKMAKITWVEFCYIRIENLNGRIPYGNSALGGAIGIHGGGSKRDWTLGCVALSNTDIDQFYDDLPVGTEVFIFP